MNHEELVEDVLNNPENAREKAAASEIHRLRIVMAAEVTKAHSRMLVHKEWSTTLMLVGSLGILACLIIRMSTRAP